MWEYAQADHIAREYDEYFAYTSLFGYDQSLLLEYFKTPGLVADLGCGTGRALVPLVEAGHRGLAVDLSAEMLAVVGDKAKSGQLAIDRVLANLVELDCLADASVDYAISMFSTLGMIRGAANRARALEHARRILKPGGLFVLHVHNYWYNLYDPGGPWWLLGNLTRGLLRRDDEEIGDKFFDYRRIPQMFLHVFRRGELRRALRQAGFKIERMLPLDPQRVRELRYPWLLSNLRANGWIVFTRAI